MRQRIDFIPVIPDVAVMHLATAFTEASEAHGTPISADGCEFSEVEDGKRGAGERFREVIAVKTSFPKRGCFKPLPCCH